MTDLVSSHTPFSQFGLLYSENGLCWYHRDEKVYMESGSGIGFESMFWIFSRVDHHRTHAGGGHEHRLHI
jgi:hypothetical protein